MLVTKEIKDRIAYITMNNGKHYNCLSEEMCMEVIEAVKNS